MFSLDGKTALITGAGSGIGREIALLFAKQGATVAVADINEAGRTGVADEIANSGGNALPLDLDVTSLDAANGAVAEMVTATGHLDILVNNAGIGMVGNLVETAPGDFARLVAVNIYGVYHCSQAALNQMLAQDPSGGSIVNIASV
ncbi:MAG: SDR family oxidoreductase, partial [Chloroflexota bacterium]|nr:SDR family oxidoreductase [Chloroflexota bacterium]